MSKAKSNAAGSLLDRYARADLWNADERRARERAAKKTAVLLTAADMFLSHGSHRVSMTDIAGQLGITNPALYNYFSCKDEIMFVRSAEHTSALQSLIRISSDDFCLK